jgi:uncharacterized protein YcfL
MYKTRLSSHQILSNVMKKIFIFVCIILGSCAFVGCNGNGTAQSEQKDSVVTDSIEIIDSTLVDTVALDSVVCPE